MVCAMRILFVFVSSAWLVNSIDVYYHPIRGSSVWGYFTPPLLKKEPPHQTPMEAMVDLTNSLGVAILQDHTFSRGNFAFSPYGVASVLVVLYEGARGESARQIHRAIGFPSDKDIIRIGFRDIHRHLRSYFSHEGYLSGISLNKETSSLKQEYKKILRFYGYDVELSPSSDEDNDMSPQKPVSPPPRNEPTKTTAARTSSTTDSGTWASPQDRNYTNASDLNSKITNPTTVVLTVLPTEKITEADQNSSESSTDQSSAEPSTDNPSNVKKMNQITTIQDKQQTPILRTTGVLTITEQPSTKEMTENIGEDKPELKTTEEATTAAATTPFLNVSTTLDDEKTTVTTEHVTTEGTGERQTSTVEWNYDGKYYLSTTVGTSTGNSEEGMSLPQRPSGLLEMSLSSTTESKVCPGTATAVEGNTAEGMEATNSVKMEEVTKSNLDNGMLIPQSDDLLNTQAAEKGTGSMSVNFGEITDRSLSLEPRLVTTTTFGSESTSGNSEGTTATEVSIESRSISTPAFGVSMNKNFGETTDTPLSLEPRLMTTTTFGSELTSINTGRTTYAEASEEPGSLSTTTIRMESASDNLEETTDAQGADTLSDMGDQFKAKNIIRISGKILKSDERLNTENIINTRVPLWLERKPKISKSRKIRTITDYLKTPHGPDMSLQLQNGMYDTHVSRNADLYRSLPRLLFLVDGAVDTPVPMMTYTNVFPYAYIPKLHAKTLEFPLDDIRYKLLILLPVERRGLRQLIYDLLDYSMSDVLSVMKPARVKAMVPTFMVEGFVILTSSLQKLGIWDVFDPRKANLSGMSMDPELYVRNVEQSVTVVIRNYVEILDIQTRTMAARYMEYEFEATHPFLYFVLDTSTNVALMAGQILDPLNSRIY